jgi:hypothetical protein
MPLSYLRDGCHKQVVTHIRESRWFESMYTLQGKTRPHDTCFLRSIRVWSTTICISRGPHIATFYTVVNIFEQIHCTWEEGLPTQSTTCRSFDPWVRTQLLSHNSQWSSGEKSSLLTTDYYAYRTHIIGMRSVRSILARGGQSNGP